MSSTRTWGEASQSSTGNAAIFHLVEKSNGPGRFRQYPLGPWRVPYSQGFHGLRWPPQKRVKVTRDIELTSHQDFFPLRARGPA